MSKDDFAPLKRYMDDSGRLIKFPQLHKGKRTHQVLALAYLASKLELDRQYSEREVNVLLNQWHTFGAHTRLRHDMLTDGLLGCSADGAVYWRLPQSTTENEK